MVVAISDASGADAIQASGLAEVRSFEDVEANPEAAAQPWRERMSMVVRSLGPRHVMAPLGLMGAPQSLDYFQTFRSALSVGPGRDLLFFEERPHCLVAEAVRLRLAGLGVRLPPATVLRSPRRYGAFALRLISGLGVPPIFGRLGERARLSSSLKASFREASDWDPQRALGPKLQPVVEPWKEDDSEGLFALAEALGRAGQFGSRKAFGRRMARHAAGGGHRTPMERHWLSLPADADPISDAY
jgi:hypothetical protein